MAVQNNLNITQAGIVYHNGAGVFTGNNLQAATNTISSTNVNGAIILSPNGTGGVVAVTDLTVGNTVQDVNFTVNGAAIAATISVEGTSATDLGGIISHRHSATAGFGGHFVNLRSRGSHAAPTVVASGDTLSIYATAGYDGTDYALASQIITQVDGTPGANDMPGRMVFLTSADGAQTPLEAMRITSEQKVGIGTTTPLDTLHVAGSMQLDYTAIAADDHALEIIANAAGFGDVKALDIDYITGALAAGQDEEVILVNIDESLSTGGIISAYLVLSTDEGGATVNGYQTGINVNPIVHESGTFGDADNILNIAVNVTAALASGGAGAITAFVADNDTMTIGEATTFSELEIVLTTPASGSGIAPTFEYSTGAATFAAFSPADGTNGFRNTGSILWDASTLAGWVTAASGRYEIRITRTRNTLTTSPVLDEVQLSAVTEYKWDKNGDVNIKSLTLVTDLSVANGGTGSSTLTDGGVLVGNGTGAITALTVGTNGQVLVGSTGADPVFATVASADGSITVTGGAGTIDLAVANPIEPLGVENLGIALAAGTFTVQGATAALSVGNPGHVTLPSKATPGLMVTYTITANQTFIDDAGASTIIGNLFSLPTGVALANPIPFFLYAVSNDAENAINFMISRVPHLLTSVAAANIGKTGSAIADTQASMFSLGNVTVADYDGNPCSCIGSFRMVMSALDDWTVQTLTDEDGIGRFNDSNQFQMAFVTTGAFGSAAGSVFLANGGTAPVFSAPNFYYYISREGTVRCYVYANTDGGTDGATAVNSLMAVPYLAATQFNGIYVGSGIVTTSSGTWFVNAQMQTAQNVALAYQSTLSTVAFFQNSNFGNGSRSVQCFLMYEAKRSA